MSNNIEIIKKLRDETGAGILEIKNMLEEQGNDYKKTREELLKKASAKAAKKSDRQPRTVGYLYSYRKVGSLVLLSVRDFVAKTEDFQKLQRYRVQVCSETKMKKYLNRIYPDPSKKISI